jgi:hypothetical protein
VCWNAGGVTTLALVIAVHGNRRIMSVSVRALHRVLLATLLFGACRVTPLVPGQGGPAWIELTSEHFVVWTDGDPEDGRALVRRMEHLRQIVFGVSVFNPTSNAKALVIALRSQRELRPYLPGNSAAFAWTPHYPLYLPGILLSIDHLEIDPIVVAHELTHVISYSALSTQPDWFSEGLAEYFGTVHLDEDDGTFDLGAVNPPRLQLLRRASTEIRSAEMLACNDPRCQDSEFYASAWALFAYLANFRAADLSRYVLRLAELPREAQSAAWSEVFPDLTPARLDVTLSEWVRFGEITVHRFKVKLKDYPVTRRVLTDGDVYTARALLGELRDLAEASDQVKAALAIDPTNVVAQMLRVAHDHTSELETARSLTAAHPDSWRAWWLVMRIVKQGTEADAAHAKVCALVARDPAVLPRGTCPFIAPAHD